MTDLVFSYGTLRLPEGQLANYGRQLGGATGQLPSANDPRLGHQCWLYVAKKG